MYFIAVRAVSCLVEDGTTKHCYIRKIARSYNIIVTGKYATLVHKFEALVHKFEALVHKFEALVHKFEALVHKFEALVHKF